MAAILFAVMPITWFIRRVLLDSILLPFFLSSVFFAIFSKNLEQQNHRNIAVLLSGIFLGLSIFIKISMVAMIPLVLYLVYHTSISKSKIGIRLGMKNMVVHWFIPVIAIPSLWPIQSIVDNQFDLWVSDVLLQSTRATEGIIAVFQSFIIVTRFFGHSIQHIKEGIYHYALDFTIRVFFVNILYSVFSFDSCNTSLVHSRSFSH